MRPAISVILLTTLIGAGQGLFLSVFAIDAIGSLRGAPPEGLHSLSIVGAATALLLCAFGLLASFFHLGHPERAWRAAAGWRTSWLSREVIALPVFMALVVAYLVTRQGDSPMAIWIGLAAALAALVLFVCTGMVYASIRIIREWASGLTVVNYLVLGMGSGATLGATLAALLDTGNQEGLALGAMTFIVAGLATRGASLVRNARIPAKTTLQTAIGVKHPKIAQRSQGAMGGSFNTREFFHGQGAGALRNALLAFLVLGCILPLTLLAFGFASAITCSFAFAIQFAGLMAERWLFFAEARHPQNLYYQSIA